MRVLRPATWQCILILLFIRSYTHTHTWQHGNAYSYSYSYSYAYSCSYSNSFSYSYCTPTRCNTIHDFHIEKPLKDERWQLCRLLPVMQIRWKPCRYAASHADQLPFMQKRWQPCRYVFAHADTLLRSLSAVHPSLHPTLPANYAALTFPINLHACMDSWTVRTARLTSLSKRDGCVSSHANWAPLSSCRTLSSPPLPLQ